MLCPRIYRRVGDTSVCRAQIQKLVDKLNFPDTAAAGRVGRVALRLLDGLATRGERSMGGSAVPEYGSKKTGTNEFGSRRAVISDLYATDGGLVSVAFFSKGLDEFRISLNGAAEVAFTRGPMQTNEIYARELFATVAAVAVLNEQLIGKRLTVRPHYMHAGVDP